MRWWDIEPVLMIEDRVFVGEPPWSREQFWAELALAPTRRWYLVAEASLPAPAGIVGYAGLALSPDAAEVMTVAVDTPVRAAGLGRRLVEALLARARECGAPEVLLEVRADNVVARRLYERLGFTTLSRRRGYYGGEVDALVMRRRSGPVEVAR